MRALKLGWTESQIKKASVTTQAHEGIETYAQRVALTLSNVTTQAHEGIETMSLLKYS